MPIPEIIAVIATAMQRQGVDQTELARRMGDARRQGHVSAILAGKRNPTAPVLQRMLDALGLEAGKMLEKSE